MHEIKCSDIGDLNQFDLSATRYDLALQVLSSRAMYAFRGEWEFTMADVRDAEARAKRNVKPGLDFYDDGTPFGGAEETDDNDWHDGYQFSLRS